MSLILDAAPVDTRTALRTEISELITLGLGKRQDGLMIVSR
jgi:hypothetical protein